VSVDKASLEIGLATGSATAVAAIPTEKGAVPDGPIRGLWRCVFLSHDAMLEIWANDAFDDWPEAARRAEELALVSGGTDATGTHWSVVMDAAVFRAAYMASHGSFPPEQILVSLPGWPDDWEAEEQRLLAGKGIPAGAIRGGLRYLPGDGAEIALIEGTDDAGRHWTISMDGKQTRMAIAAARALQTIRAN
jgi:hypothetical protein